jgi:hypothetical protein
MVYIPFYFFTLDRFQAHTLGKYSKNPDTLPACKPCHTQVKARIIYQDQCIWPVPGNIFFAISYCLDY